MEGGTLSRSVPHLMSYDAVDIIPGCPAPTVLLPSTGLLTSITDLPFDARIVDCLNSNSNYDTSSHLPYSSTRSNTSNTKAHSQSLGHLLAFNKRHKSNSDNLLTHPQLEGDLLSTQDWGEGEVGEKVDSIVQALMKKTVSSAGEGGGREGRGGNKRGHCDPRVTMEMRHRQVCTYKLSQVFHSWCAGETITPEMKPHTCIDWTMSAYTCTFQLVKSGYLTSLRTPHIASLKTPHPSQIREVPLYVHVYRYVSVGKLEMRRRRKK